MDMPLHNGSTPGTGKTRKNELPSSPFARLRSPLPCFATLRWWGFMSENGDSAPSESDRQPLVDSQPRPSSFSFSPDILRQRVGRKYLRDEVPARDGRLASSSLLRETLPASFPTPSPSANDTLFPSPSSDTSAQYPSQDSEGDRQGAEGSSSQSKENKGREDDGKEDFECNICFEPPTDPVVTVCGHLYCWPCLSSWLDRSAVEGKAACPVCKAGFTKDNVIPLFGRSSSRTDPRSRPTPPRPAPQRPDPPPPPPRPAAQRQPGGVQWTFSTPFGTWRGGPAGGFAPGPFGMFGGFKERIRILSLPYPEVTLCTQC
ncbi:hypothetical protein M427DRAFT_173282 [Gonapodya prolifera JEL478]|uniref:RING-type E3 ubiquitin transferase n=1 Tax=Gonapodya prolifera (strain JEL478) TaxID=1344416 RepID=A0A139B164_GONPJ|nr:hypothetical protein M427DRAFT_173282 [Gonapodya prolifera JEL478]|eukprot:KXS22465.1 hypothetical protein M427DRAFT_173282 [Gonapodya prolifera JEL478]